MFLFFGYYASWALHKMKKIQQHSQKRSPLLWHISLIFFNPGILKQSNKQRAMSKEVFVAWKCCYATAS